MTETTKQTVVVDAQAALTFIQTILPILEAAGVATGPTGMAVSAAAQLLLPMIAQIPTGKLITVAEQADLYHRAANLMDFSGPQWVPSNAIKPATA